MPAHLPLRAGRSGITRDILHVESVGDGLNANHPRLVTLSVRRFRTRQTGPSGGLALRNKQPINLLLTTLTMANRYNINYDFTCISLKV